jgi:hypothetical protein
MELVILRLGDGVGALLFLTINGLFDPPTQMVGLMILLAAVVWLLVARYNTEEYAQMLRRSLEYVGSRAVRRVLNLEEAVAENTLISSLRSNNSEKVLFALKQLRVHESESDFDAISSPDFSGEMVSVDVSGIYQTSSLPTRWLGSVEPLVDHPDSRIGAVALDFMIKHDVADYRTGLHKKLSSFEIPEERFLTFLEQYAEDPGEWLDQRFVVQWYHTADPEQKAHLAGLLGMTQNPGYLPLLRDCLKSDSKRLRRSALRALGKFGATEDIATLVEHLPNHWSRRAARRGLADYGESLVTHLLGLIRNPKVDVRIKREIPYILTQIDTSSARGVLVASLYAHDALTAYRALRSLNTIRDRQDLSYSQESFMPLLQIWAKEYYGLLNMDVLMHMKQSRATRLLQQAIKERISWSIEKIFRGLDLFLPHGDAYFSYLGFTSNRQDLRENAIELIDSRIKGELRQTLLPIFAEFNSFDVVRKGREIFKLPSDPQKALSEAFFHADPWLKCCTIGAALVERMDGLKDLVSQACDDINPLVRQTATWAIERWDSPPND